MFKLIQYSGGWPCGIPQCGATKGQTTGPAGYAQCRYTKTVAQALSKMDKFFKASAWDPLLQFITIAVTLSALAFIYYNPKPVTIVVMGALILIPPFFMIKGYSINEQKLIIHRLGWTKELDLNDLASAEFNPQAIRGSWRLLGNGGLYGWIGTFSNKELGTFRAYATNRYKCVVLKLKNKTLIVTPNSPREFVESIKTLI